MTVHSVAFAVIAPGLVLATQRLESTCTCISTNEEQRTVMSIVSHTHPFVVGVDTHAGNNVFTILLAATAALMDSGSFPNTDAGTQRALSWIGRRTDGDLATLIVVEGAASYGTRIASGATRAGYLVVEAPLATPRTFHAQGKSDTLDSHRIAASVLALEPEQLRYPRLDTGARGAMRVLLTARTSLTKERTHHNNALTALVRTVPPLGVDVRRPLTTTQVATISAWRTRAGEDLTTATARREAVRLAQRIKTIDQELKANTTAMTEVVAASEVAPLTEESGIGVWVAAVILEAWSHAGRINTEAQFASLAGVNPVPASSGNKTRFRLNRGGDRQLNQALHTVVRTRMAHDPDTKAYVTKRRAEGKTTKEIMRCLKRYVARSIFRILKTLTTPIPATT